MTSADGNGNWHFATNNLLTGTHVFTATDKVGGQTSGPSAAFSLTVDAASSSTTPFNLNQLESFNFQNWAHTHLGGSLPNTTAAHSLDANLQMFANAMNQATVTAADTTTAGATVDASGLSHLTKIMAGAEFHFI